MVIYFFPEKQGEVYLCPVNKPLVKMDCTVVGLDGFIKLVEERCGLFHKDLSFNHRMCRWFEIMKPWLESHPENILYRSYKLNQLSMADQMLHWRDELKMTGWDFSIEDTTSRLGALSAIEKDFKYPGLPDYLTRVIKEVGNMGNDAFSGDTISLPYERKLLNPLVKDLIDALEGKGAKIEVNRHAKDSGNNLGVIRSLLNEDSKAEKIRLSDKDDSFKILSFRTRKDEEEYLVLNPPSKDSLWIVSDNKSFDNRLEGMGKAAIGSQVLTRSRVTALLHLLVSLYCRPLDIRNIVEWLTSPYHPLPGNFRYQLADRVASTGGYLNPECNALIQEFIDGKFEPAEKEEEKDSKRKKRKKTEADREEIVKAYLPYYYGLESLEDLKNSLETLKSWASNYTFMLKETEDKDAFIRQFNALADGISNLLLLMFDDKGGEDISTLLQWTSEVTPEVSLEQYPTEVGSYQAITFCGDIAVPVDSIIWMGLEGMVAPSAECEFLFPGEREAIKNKARFTDPKDESERREILQMMPFLMAEDKMVITYASKRGGEDITSHPLLLRLNCQIENLKDFITEIDILEIKDVVVDKVANHKAKEEYTIKNTESIRWPAMMSPTSIETMILHPFDFFFEKIIGLRGAGMANLPALNTTKGNVAHAVIADFFTTYDFKEKSTAETLEKEYDRLVDKAIQEYGALLLLPENIIDSKVFKLQLRESLEKLINIISDNELEVAECEGWKFGNFDICEGNEEGNDMNGKLDMLLKDKEGNPVVFDFKWSSGHFYKEKLKKDRSVQLCVYEKMVESPESETRVPTAYFFMPKGELVTRNPRFVGRDVVIVDSSVSSGNLYEKIRRSYKYRRQQIENGVLEGCDFSEIAKLQYQKDTETEDLLPLEEYHKNPELKAENRFSNYKLFKGSK